jgi:hypothetical protein
MNSGRSVFSQLVDFLPTYEFQRCVDRYGGSHKVQSFTCMNQFLTMAFAQITYRESLRDIVTCLGAMQPKLFHMGIRGRVARTTLADANETRDWRIYEEFAQVLIRQARQLYSGESLGLELEGTVYALDSTTIDLCLSVFPWAHFRRRKAAVKVHTQLDLRGQIPTFIRITEGRSHDVKFLDELLLEPGSIYVMDRAYVDFRRLYEFELSKAIFVTRAKRRLQFRRVKSFPVDKDSGLRCDQVIMLTGTDTEKDYPAALRRVRFYDTDQRRSLVFLCNDFLHPAITIAQLYKCRWQVELFFKWIKQHLRIKAFYGTSENAVKTQIWIAITVYVLVSIAKKQLNIDISLSAFLQILSISVFEKVPIIELVGRTARMFAESDSCKPLLPFDLYPDSSEDRYHIC